MLFLFRYIFGYLIIEFSGDFCENVLNAAARNHIGLWNLAYKKGKITGCVSVKHFRRIRCIREGKKVKIKILKKCGLPFKTVKYKNRSGFIVGAAIFIFMLNFLSSYIWNIEVSGNKSIKSEEILNLCSDLGVTTGIKSKSVNSNVLSQRLALKNPKIAWASFNVEGSKLTVNITETKQEANEDKKTPVNILASSDGIIKKIDITGGEVQIKIGDTVKKGDLLVSGVHEGIHETVFDKVAGEIYAKTNRVFVKSKSYKQELYENTGEILERKALSVFNLNIPLYLGNVKGDYISRKEKKNLKLLGKEIPISITEKEFTIQKKKTVIYSKERLCKILEKEIEEEIKGLNIEHYETLSFSVEETQDGITVKKEITAEENIAKFEKILINTEN